MDEAKKKQVLALVDTAIKSSAQSMLHVAEKRDAYCRAVNDCKRQIAELLESDRPSEGNEK